MLKKLIKYDFRDQGKLLWPLHLALLLGSLIAGFCLMYNLNSLRNIAENAPMSALRVISMVVITLVMSAIIASSIVTIILVGRQYYRNCFCDEGYLTFTLPVSPSQVLLSKLITGSAWSIINLVAAITRAE